ncbi:MAG: hypothetical protein ABW124_01220 [Candidatus Thiodiazotropha sp. 6PLUC9]
MLPKRNLSGQRIVATTGYLSQVHTQNLPILILNQSGSDLFLRFPKELCGVYPGILPGYRKKMLTVYLQIITAATGVVFIECKNGFIAIWQDRGQKLMSYPVLAIEQKSRRNLHN